MLLNAIDSLKREMTDSDQLINYQLEVWYGNQKASVATFTQIILPHRKANHA